MTVIERVCGKNALNSDSRKDSYTLPPTSQSLTRVCIADGVVPVTGLDGATARESRRRHRAVLEPVERAEDGHEAVEVEGGLGGQERGRGRRAGLSIIAHVFHLSEFLV